MLVVVLGVALQLAALFRSLDVRDDHQPRYRRTVRLLEAGVVTRIAGLVRSAAFG